MIETLSQFAVESLTDSFETTAFISPMPAEPPYEPIQDAVLLSVRFTGSSCGTVEMVASRRVGRLAAENMLGSDPESSTHYEDALTELLNIFGGLMLRRWALESGEPIEMTLPAARDFDAGVDWQSFVSSPGTTVLDVEGNLVALRIRGC